MSDIQELIDLLVQFRDDRDWGQFHDSKNLALALSIEAAELNELFLWKKDHQSETVEREKLKEELQSNCCYEKHSSKKLHHKNSSKCRLYRYC